MLRLKPKKKFPIETVLAALNTQFEHQDVGILTYREFFRACMLRLWVEGEGFSGKRPFGNSGWENDLYIGLAAAGYIDGKLVEEDEDYVEWDYDQEAGDALIEQMIEAL